MIAPYHVLSLFIVISRVVLDEIEGKRTVLPWRIQQIIHRKDLHSIQNLGQENPTRSTATHTLSWFIDCLFPSRGGGGMTLGPPIVSQVALPNPPPPISPPVCSRRRGLSGAGAVLGWVATAGGPAAAPAAGSPVPLRCAAAGELALQDEVGQPGLCHRRAGRGGGGDWGHSVQAVAPKRGRRGSPSPHNSPFHHPNPSVSDAKVQKR